jgi:hypothetical protein
MRSVLGRNRGEGESAARRPRSGWLAVCAAISIFWPKLALACPACAGTETRNAMFLRVGSLFVLVPFLVVGVVLYVLRQAPERDRTAAPHGR